MQTMEIPYAWQADKIYQGTDGYGHPHSPLLFGAFDKAARRTLITNEPLEVSRALYTKLILIAAEVSRQIECYPLEGKADQIGADPNYLAGTLALDAKTSHPQFPDHLVYGGLDVYVDPTEGPKVLEINARVQAMGLQEARQNALGINDQPKMVDHFADRVKGSGVENVMVLGSKLNPFWRAHARLARQLGLAGLNCSYNSIEEFSGLWNQGFRPEIIVRLCNSDNVLNLPQSADLKEKVVKHNIPFINSLSSTFYGDRGFLKILDQHSPGLLPAQKVLGKDVDEVELERYPWVKLEAGKEFAYVVNYRDLRRWGRDSLRALISGDLASVDNILGAKDNGDALALREVKDKIKDLPSSQVNWIAQQDVKPLVAKLGYTDINGITSDLDFHILHRVYFVRSVYGPVDVSLEAFGCTKEQFSQSKGKVNAGTGVAIPLVIR